MLRLVLPGLALPVLGLGLSLAVATASGAATIQLAGVLDGDQANAGAGTGSTGSGTVSLAFDDVTNELTWSSSFSGLLGDFTVAHFHGPAEADEGAGIQVPVSYVLSPDERSGTSNGSATLSTTQADQLLDELWYLNVHSEFAPGGEIRANLSIVPEPGTLALLAGGALALLAARRRGR